jgi:hypothetical protein
MGKALVSAIAECYDDAMHGAIRLTPAQDCQEPVSHPIIPKSVGELKSVGESESAEQPYQATPKPVEHLKSCLKPAGGLYYSHRSNEGCEDDDEECGVYDDSCDSENSDDEDSDDDIDPEECRLVYEQLMATNPEACRLAAEHYMGACNRRVDSSDDGDNDCWSTDSSVQDYSEELPGPDQYSDGSYGDVTDFEEHCDHLGPSHEDFEASVVMHYDMGQAAACEKTLTTLSMMVESVEVAEAATLTETTEAERGLYHWSSILLSQAS